jgi:hypothetical protein
MRPSNIEMIQTNVPMRVLSEAMDTVAPLEYTSVVDKPSTTVRDSAGQCADGAYPRRATAL